MAYLGIIQDQIACNVLAIVEIYYYYCKNNGIAMSIILLFFTSSFLFFQASMFRYPLKVIQVIAFKIFLPKEMFQV